MKPQNRGACHSGDNDRRREVDSDIAKTSWLGNQRRQHIKLIQKQKTKAHDTPVLQHSQRRHILRQHKVTKWRPPPGHDQKTGDRNCGGKGDRRE